MTFPDGPFFNFRVAEEFPVWKRLVWKLFGSKRVGSDGDYRVTAYHFRSVTYIAKVELERPEWVDGQT